MQFGNQFEQAFNQPWLEINTDDFENIFDLIPDDDEKFEEIKMQEPPVKPEESEFIITVDKDVEPISYFDFEAVAPKQKKVDKMFEEIKK